MTFTLGNYYPAASLLHKLDPRTKILASLLLMIVLFMINQPLPLAVFGLFLAVMIALSGVPFRLVLKSVKPVVFLAVFAWVLNVFTTPDEHYWFSWSFLHASPQGFWVGLRMAVRLFFLVMATQLCLTLTTTPLEMADGIERLLRPLARWGFPSHELAMMMSIALRFVPTLADETDKIMKAQSSRGADYDTGGAIARARGLVSVLIPLFVSALKRADELATAMEARCYRGGEGRTRLHVLRFGTRDGWAALSLTLVLAVLLVLEYTHL
ncbi:MAG: energy-coupling factor transporter transmembrane component T [Oscillospiraceae bacterium]|nr:energy-coupling factor transporter transmembrane component T [Oscillospiraceae bacterium]